MKISDIGEFGLIGRINKVRGRPSPEVLAGIGDDAAALLFSRGAAVLATTDMLIDGVHFDLAYTDVFSLGWKSAAVNLSDIAAMGGAPRYCLTALAIPRHITVEDIEEFYRGFRALCARHGVRVVGGDTCASHRGLVISVTALGEAGRDGIVRRSGARPGDRIFVTGSLGDSAAGLELLKARGKGPGSKVPGEAKRLMERHLRPVPRIAWGMSIAAAGCATAMIDVSDGLVSDLGHLCRESGVGAEINEGGVPLSRALRSAAAGIKLRYGALRYALTGGEDYELLLAVPPERVRRLSGLVPGAREIGVFTRGRGIFMRDRQDRKRPAPSIGGYDHFSPGTGA